MGGGSSLLYISIAYYMQKGGEGVQKSCKNAYVISGRPLSTGTRQAYRLLITVCLSPLTSEKYAGVIPESSFTQNQEPIPLAFTCTYLWLVLGLLFFHRHFSLPPYYHQNLMTHLLTILLYLNKYFEAHFPPNALNLHVFQILRISIEYQMEYQCSKYIWKEINF